MKITNKVLEYIGDTVENDISLYPNQFRLNYSISPKSHHIDETDRTVIDIFISYYTIESKEQYEDTLHFSVPEDLNPKNLHQFCNKITDNILDYIKSESFSEKVDE